MMQIDWVNILATVTVASVALSAVVGAGSLFVYKISQARAARTSTVVVDKKSGR